MPIARYFIIVGGTLAALLFIAGWCLPTPPAMFAHQLAIDRLIIRIKSARKWPEKVVLDTSQATITPPAVEEPPAAQSVRLSPDEAGDQSNLEALPGRWAMLTSNMSGGSCATTKLTSRLASPGVRATVNAASKAVRIPHL